MAKDEKYIIDICDPVLCRKASRQHRFAFLLGDAGTPLPVDAYYQDLALVVEYRERQHIDPVAFWDKKPTVSGVPRGRQRALYDARRREVLPQYAIALVEFTHSDFQCDSRSASHVLAWMTSGWSVRNCQVGYDLANRAVQRIRARDACPPDEARANCWSVTSYAAI